MNIPKYTNAFRSDLELKSYADNTIDNYVSQIKVYLHRFNSEYTEPCKIPERQIKNWLLESNTINGRRSRLSALKLFYKMTVRQPMKLRYIEYPRAEKKLPIVLSQSEIQDMFNICHNLKHRVILAILYACGLRISELLNLRWKHVDRKNKVIYILAGKGKKDRQVPLPDILIDLLEQYYRAYKPHSYIIQGQFGGQYSEKSVNEVLKALAFKAGIRKKVHAHLIRHCTMTHLLEGGVDISIIQKIAGHSNPKTTQIYTHISSNLLSHVHNPLNSLNI